MRCHIRDVLGLAGSALGRRELRAHLYSRAQPVLEAAGGLHRRTFARRCRLVAVVGSFGKTTTTAALAAALKAPILRSDGKGMGRIAAAILKIRPGHDRVVLEIGIDRKGQMASRAAALALLTIRGTRRRSSCATSATGEAFCSTATIRG